MIRTIIIPDNETVSLSFSVPKDYIGKEIEIIAFAKGEGVQKMGSDRSKSVTFNAATLDTTGFKFSRDEANER